MGAASGVFPKRGPATLPPIKSSETFLATYQDVRKRSFTIAEQEIAWAASLWPTAHDLRWEALHGAISDGGTALRAQAAERLRRSNA